MATLQPHAEYGSLEVPIWLRRNVDTWTKIPGVEAVVLFGRRASGSHQKSSDWDIAILHQETLSRDMPCDEDFLRHLVDMPFIPVDKFINEAHQVGTLAHEITANGLVLGGRVPTIEERRLELGEEELSRHLFFAFHNLASAMGDIQTDLTQGDADESSDSIIAYVSSASSADGAERTAKALCVHLGVSYSHAHNVKMLSESVPKGWRERVLDLDGNTTKAHLAVYEGSFESVSDAIKRVAASLSLLNELIQPSRKQLSLSHLCKLSDRVQSDSVMKNSLSYLGAVDAHAETLKLSKQMSSVLEMMQKHLMERKRQLD